MMDGLGIALLGFFVVAAIVLIVPQNDDYEDKR
jgi:hypothetical protein